MNDKWNSDQSPEQPEGVFKVGDVVRLRSGGPQMTIIEVDGPEKGLYSTVHFKRNGKFKELLELPGAVLQFVSDEITGRDE